MKKYDLTLKKATLIVRREDKADGRLALENNIVERVIVLHPGQYLVIHTGEAVVACTLLDERERDHAKLDG